MSTSSASSVRNHMMPDCRASALPSYHVISNPPPLDSTKFQAIHSRAKRKVPSNSVRRRVHSLSWLSVQVTKGCSSQSEFLSRYIVHRFDICLPAATKKTKRKKKSKRDLYRNVKNKQWQSSQKGTDCFSNQLLGMPG